MAKTGMSDPGSDGDGNGNTQPDPGPDQQPEPCPDASQALCVISKSLKVSTPVSILIESLVKNLCTAYETDRTKAMIMYDIICERLHDMKLIDESYKMMEFEGIRLEYESAFHKLLLSASFNSAFPKAIRPGFDIDNSSNSHYHKEFEEIEYIAGGGFGKVYKVRHKLDGTEYAMKKIPIRSEGLESVKNYLSEVKTFASVNHPNIVQYKAAWLDTDESNANAIQEYESYSDWHQNSAEPTIEHLSDNYIYHEDSHHSFSNRITEDGSDFVIDFEHSFTNVQRSEKSYSSTSGVKVKRPRRHSVSEGNNAIWPLRFNELAYFQDRPRTSTKWATLYIQMALCQSTLKHWLEQRNSIDLPDRMTALVMPDTATEILKQLLKGIQYIHKKGIVHHDIKPSNIFVQNDDGKLLIQLGDFGLACPLQSVKHSLALGTRTYAAPEQLAGECNRKSDMYSLGIVLFELVQTFRTDMERVKHITELQKGILPQQLSIQQPQLAQIISQLVARRPEDRPDAQTLLKTITSRSHCSTKQIEELKSQLVEKDEEIARLKDLLKTAGVKSI